jgi:hypothetical protein
MKRAKSVLLKEHFYINIVLYKEHLLVKIVL